MAFDILIGTALVLVTWALAAVALTALGQAAASALDPAKDVATTLRAAQWWGLGIATVLILWLGLAQPLRNAWVAAILLIMTVVLGAVGLVTIRRRGGGLSLLRPTTSVVAVLIAFAAMTCYLAVKALGPATNYDTGLYHLGALKYAGDFTTIPGLATLFVPLAYNNAQFPIAAFLGNGPWDGAGFRLLNGLLILLVTSDATWRLLARRYTWGTFILLIGIGSCAVPLVAMADFWVTSPSSDTAILLLTIVSSAYLADFLSERTERGTNMAVSLVVTAVMVAMRPTVLFYAAVLAAVVVATLWRRRRATEKIRWPAWALLAILGVALATVQIVRDRLLSGWLLYPLSLVHFDVPWLALDPTAPRNATLAAARDSSAPDQYVVAHSWQWIGPWLSRLPSQWEPCFFVVALGCAIVVVVLARRSVGFPRHPARIVACTAPCAVAIVAWFVVSPPSFRFIWGPLFCLAIIPMAAAIHALAARGAELTGPLAHVMPVVLVGVAVVIAAVVGFSAIARNQVNTISEKRSWTLGPISLPYAVTPIPKPPVQRVTMRSGLVLIAPVTGDQCWDNYPLCSFSMGDTVALRGETIQDGFVQQQ